MKIVSPNPKDDKDADAETDPYTYMPPAEFRRLGLLREINRQFLHPLGLSLHICKDAETGEEYFGRVRDYRANGPEGIAFTPSDLDTDAVRDSTDALELARVEREQARKALFGWIIQPIPGRRGEP